MPVERLKEWRWSSYPWLRKKQDRPNWLRAETALAEAGALVDETAGWRAYDNYLAWQATAGPAGKGAAYVSMSRGWALGTDQFRAALVQEFNLAATSRAWEVSPSSAVRIVNRLFFRVFGAVSLGGESRPSV